MSERPFLNTFPSRQKSDLVKPDAGVAARARQAGQFSDARVLVAADLWASSFSESSISAKTKKMQESIIKVRDVIGEMQEVARLGLGEEKTGGLFGLVVGQSVAHRLSASMLQRMFSTAMQAMTP